MPTIQVYRAMQSQCLEQANKKYMYYADVYKFYTFISMVYTYYTFVKSMLIRINSNGEKGGPPPVFPVSVHGQLSHVAMGTSPWRPIWEGNGFLKRWAVPSSGQGILSTSCGSWAPMKDEVAPVLKLQPSALFWSWE